MNKERIKKTQAQSKKQIFLLALILSFTSVVGQGFSPTAINWMLPAGGYVQGGTNHSFDGSSNAYGGDPGSQQWVVMDIDGDSKNDLVIYSFVNGSVATTYNPITNPHWLVYLNTGSGFSMTGTNWQLPPGGKLVGGFCYSFNSLGSLNAGTQDPGSQNWTVMDMNGDSKPDIVVLSELSGGLVTAYSPNSNPYWKVYLNTGSGFATSPINWPLPAGGQINLSNNNLSFYETSNYDAVNGNVNSVDWCTMDINGDLKPDLCVTGIYTPGLFAAFSATNNPFWKVYLNNGSGFATSPINWTLPAGGFIYNGQTLSFTDNTSNNSYQGSANCQDWVTTDIDGDLKPDLVIPSFFNNGVAVTAYNPGTNPHWLVYFNTGAGFSTSSTNWQLPPGGFTTGGTPYSFKGFAYSTSYQGDANSQDWATIDIDGDFKKDLVVPSYFNNGAAVTAYNPGTNPHWLVYFNTGTGFSISSTNWQLPSGGFTTGGTPYSFKGMAFSNSYQGDTGSQDWVTIDMDGNKTLDLLVPSYWDGTNVTTYNPNNNPYWKVYLNTAIPPVGLIGFESKTDNLFLFPNPSSGSLLVMQQAAALGKVEMYNSMGSLIYTGETKESKMELDLSKQANGIYFVKVGSTTKKIIKE